MTSFPLSHFCLVGRFVLSLIIFLFIASIGFSQSEHDGFIIYSTSNGVPPKVFFFRDLRWSSSATAFVKINDDTLITINRSTLSTIVFFNPDYGRKCVKSSPFPNSFNRITIFLNEDISSIANQEARDGVAKLIQTLADMKEKYPAVDSKVTPYLNALKSDLEKYDTGNVKVSGTWQSAKQYQDFIKSTASSASSDSIILKDGNILIGNILRQDNDRVVIELDYGVFNIPISRIQTVKREAAEQASTNEPLVSGQVIPPWRNIVNRVNTMSWVTGYQQIPATVIDTGVFKDVPYLSLRINDDYELNIYGDPDKPVAVEIGIYRRLLDSETAKNNCLNFIAELMPASVPKSVFSQLSRTGADKKDIGELSFETTPPTAADSYGGWWITVYNEREVDQARASQKELSVITTAKTPKTDNSANPLVWSKDDIKFSRPSSPKTTTDLSISTEPIANPTTYSSGSVYVHGYFRKNGTYVQAYTRSSSHK